MKKLILAAFVFLPALVFADSSTDKKILKELGVETVDQLIQPKKVADGIYTPYAVWFTQSDDSAPTCVLINKDDFTNVLDIMSPSEGEFPNCHQTIDDPVISKIGKDYYATYVYVVEDTRSDFETRYQLIKLTKEKFFACKKDYEISKAIGKNVKSKKMKLDAAIEKTIKQFGCAEVLKQDDDEK